MNLSQISPQKRLIIFALIYLTLACFCAGCASRTGTTGGPVTATPEAGAPVSYTPGAGQVLIRLIDAPGNIFPSLRAVPMWELYGDGTLLYQTPSASSGTLLQAQLQPSEVAHILDIVVNRDTFFATKKSLYGKLMPDGGELVLTVNTNKQQKTVSLYGEQGAPAEDQHMFAIVHFLQSYRPVSSHPYIAPGAIVLARPYSSATTPVDQWPYPDLSLRQIASQECKTFFPGGQGSCATGSAPTGYFPIYGKRGTDLLARFAGQPNLVMSQNNQNYVILVWPLLPENLLVQPDGKRWVETEGMNGGRWQLLPGAH